MNVLVTGGAGFIGSHVVDMLIDKGHNIIVIDNMSQCNNLCHLSKNPRLNVIKADLNDSSKLKDCMKNVDVVYHLAANSDIRCGGQNPDLDFKNTLLTTKNVLDAMIYNDVKKIFFSSTSAVYGDRPGISLKEDIGGLAPVSYYGAAKLASEALISSYVHMNDMNALVFRFPNVIGLRLTHGVIFDFIKKLKNDSKKLEILGDGNQVKEYIHVHDLVSAIATVPMPSDSKVEIFNVGTESTTSVKQIADIVCDALNHKNVEYLFTGGNVGWKGDVPMFKYDISKIKKAGWKYQYSSTEAVKKTLSDLVSKNQTLV